MLEAIIAVCWQVNGPEETAAAVVDTFQPEIENAVRTPADSKSLLQEHLAETAATVRYTAAAPTGPPHQPTFTVDAIREPGGQVIGHGVGPSKKAAEADAARDALGRISSKG